jgi:hypothetical protein
MGGGVGPSVARGRDTTGRCPQEAG